MSFDFRAELTSNIPHLRAYARSLARAADQADDLVQDTLLRALAARGQFTPGTNFRAWLFTILRNQWVNGLRRQRFSSDEDADELVARMPVDASQETRLELQDYARAMSRLSSEHAEILMLVGANGMSYDEAAEVCGCAVGTVKSRLSRARRELERLLDGAPGRLPVRSAFVADHRARLALRKHGTSGDRRVTTGVGRARRPAEAARMAVAG